MVRKIVLVADPGIDGAFAIALALHDPDLDAGDVAVGRLHRDRQRSLVAEGARWRRRHRRRRHGLPPPEIGHRSHHCEEKKENDEDERLGT